jgi:hypothetical protein
VRHRTLRLFIGRACDFFDLFAFLHKRFAQDDGFVEAWNKLVGYAENKKRSKKSQALRMTVLWEF